MSQFELSEADLNLITAALAHHAIRAYDEADRFNNPRISAVFNTEGDRIMDLRERLRA